MLNDIFIRQGRYIEPGRGNEVLISEAFAEANQLQLGDSIGAIINGKWATVTDCRDCPVSRICL